MFKPVLAKLGRCPRCFRLAARGAVLGWSALLLVAALWPGWVGLRPLMLWPLSFSALWLSHLIAFAWRRVSARLDVPRAPGTKVDGGNRIELMVSRRRALGIFAGALLTAFLASVAFAGRARADGCPDGYPLDCHDGACCPANHTLYCPQASDGPSCTHVLSGKCYDPSTLSDEELAALRNCCPGLVACS